MAQSQKITVTSISDLKNTTDDALANYLNSLKFRQDHTLTDVRLALGFSSAAIAAATFYYDWKLGFETTKGYTLWAVVLYFLLNGALTLWIWVVERGRFYVGESNGTKVSFSSFAEKHVPVYNLRIQSQLPGNDYAHTFEVKAPFTKWFTGEGYFVAKPFQAWLAGEIPVVGTADPKSKERGQSEKVVKTIDNLGDVKSVTGSIAADTDFSASPSNSTRSKARKGKS
jgi:hypothetical protein